MKDITKTLQPITDKEIRNILMDEFKNEERIWAMQSFFGREAVIKIIKWFLDGNHKNNEEYEQ